MLRWTIALLVAMAVVRPAAAADGAVPRQSAERAVANCRQGCRVRITNTGRASSTGAAASAGLCRARSGFADSRRPTDPAATSRIAAHAAACRAPRRCPAITGGPFDYDYQGPYYGGPNVGYCGPPALRLRRLRLLLSVARCVLSRVDTTGLPAQPCGCLALPTRASRSACKTASVSTAIATA